MNRIKKIIISTLITTCIASASESFGGIGISFQKEGDGIKIIDIIPSTPAAESKLKINDIIIAVDGISLKGKSIEDTKKLLRGPQNKPIEVTYASDGETYSTILSRVQITVKPIKKENIENWYGNKEKLNSHEIETYASATEDNKKLLAVLKKGAVLQADEQTSASNLSGIYTEKASKSSFTNKDISKSDSHNISSLKSFNRKAIAFNLKEAGKVTITITNVDGKQIAQFSMNDAKVGYNTVSWNGEKIPSGNYTVSIDCNSSTSGTIVTLN